MNREFIHNQLQELLEAIQEQHDAIRAHEDLIPQIELDILLENTRKLYEKLHLLQKVQSGHAPPSLQSGHAPTLPEHSTPSPATTATAPPHHGTTAPPPEIKSVERPPSALKKEEEAAKKSPKPANLDLFADEEPTFSMKLKEARENSLPRKAEPIEHLKQLIGINDKFSFMNELFDGNLKDYNEAIETLNGFKQRNDAYEYLELLRKKNLWEMESGTLMKLKEIVERRYPH